VGSVQKIAGVPFPLPPMIAVTATGLPTSRPGGWSFEPKFDGFRCLAFASGGRVKLQSKQCRSLQRYFPEVVEAITALDTELVLDGELVVWQRGRLDFGALQQRLHPAASRARALSLSMPAAYVVFDVLCHEGVDLRRRPYRERRQALERLLERRLPNGLVLMPMSTDPAVAQAWLVDHTDAGVEGVVAKRLDQTYRAGGRSWQKVKARRTAEAVVGGILGPPEHPEALVVGRHDDNRRLRIAGRTSPLAPTARAQLAALLTLEDGPHPWPKVIPSSRFGQRPSEPVEYTRVVPNVIVELDVDTSFADYRWRHPTRFVRMRADLAVDDL